MQKAQRKTRSLQTTFYSSVISVLIKLRFRLSTNDVTNGIAHFWPIKIYFSRYLRSYPTLSVEVLHVFMGSLFYTIRHVRIISLHVPLTETPAELSSVPRWAWHISAFCHAALPPHIVLLTLKKTRLYFMPQRPKSLWLCYNTHAHTHTQTGP